jgi:hypothetical protein
MTKERRKLSNTIHWIITEGGSSHTGTTIPELESWPHMVRFLRETAPNGFLVAYQFDGDYHEINFKTDNPTTAEDWFSVIH